MTNVRIKKDVRMRDRYNKKWRELTDDQLWKWIRETEDEHQKGKIDIEKSQSE